MSQTDSADAGVTGRLGVLRLATRGADGPGEVVIEIRGGSESYAAFSTAPLPLGASVLVVAERGPREVLVEPWTLDLAGPGAGA